LSEICELLRKQYTESAMGWCRGWLLLTRTNATSWGNLQGGKRGASWASPCYHAERCLSLTPSLWFHYIPFFSSRFFPCPAACAQSKATPEKGDKLPHLGRAFTDAQELRQVIWLLISCGTWDVKTQKVSSNLNLCFAWTGFVFHHGDEKLVENDVASSPPLLLEVLVYGRGVCCSLKKIRSLTDYLSNSFLHPWLASPPLAFPATMSPL